VTAATARLTPVAAVALAGAGFALSWERLRAARLDRWAVVLAGATFALFAAPALLTGEPTVLGYASQGDAANHFVIVDRLMSHGYSVASLDPSSYRGTVDAYFVTAYPTGSHTVLGAVRALAPTDVAWLLQSYLAALAVLSALGLHSLVAPYARRRWLAAFAAGLAVSAGLVYSYATNQQAVKELAALVCIVAAVGIVRPLVAAPAGWRAALPAAVVIGGGLGVLSLALAPWIGPLALLVLVALVVRHARRRPLALLAELGAFAAAAAVLALPALTRASSFVATTDVSLTGAQEMGNLLRALEFVQALGIWPAPDFRFAIPEDLSGAWLLVGTAAVAALLGVVAAVRRCAWPVLMFAAVSLAGFAAVAGSASPWTYAKALMLLSPVALLLAGVAIATWWDGGRRAEATVLALALAGGVAWTDALSYHDAAPAPYERLRELQELGHRFAGQGPMLYLDFEELAKHFLRDARPVGAAEAYRPAWAATPSGYTVDFGYDYDVDDYVQATVARYFPLVLLRPGPTTSRPSADYERTWSGRYYDVWRRRGGGRSRVLEHLPLGTRTDAAARPECAAVRRLAASARRQRARLAYVERAPVIAARVGAAPAPGGWTKLAGDDEIWRVLGPGRVAAPVRVAAAGTYHVWLEGSVGRRATVLVDGRAVGSVANEVSQRPAQLHVATARLDAGHHDVSVEVGGGSLAPGNGSRDRLVGPVSLTRAANPVDRPIRVVAPSAWRAVCASHADWVEVVR